MNSFLPRKMVLPIGFLIGLFCLCMAPKTMAQPYTVNFEVCGVPAGATQLTLFTQQNAAGTPGFVFGTQNPLTGDWNISVTFGVNGTGGPILFPNWSLGAGPGMPEANALIANFCPCAQPSCLDVPGINGNCTPGFMNHNPELNGVDGSTYKVNWGQADVTLVPPGPAITCPPNINVPDLASAIPAITGMATSSNPNVTISSLDIVTPATCAAGPSISRVWTAIDECGEAATCIQQITTSDVYSW